MASPVTMKDIASKAGVSITTVGHVLRGTGPNNIRVGKETSSKVRKIANKLNYTPNRTAQQLVKKRSMTIGVLMDPFPSEENSLRIAEINHRARELGYHLMILHEKPEPGLIAECLSEFNGWGIDGMICVHHTYPASQDLIPKMVISAVEHVVFLDKPAMDGVSFAGADFLEATRAATTHLIERGYRRIALAVCDLQWYSGPIIKQGYIKGLKEAGLVIDEKLVWVDSRDLNSDLVHIPPEIAFNIIDRLVIEQKADAIITHDDYMAAQLLNCLKERGFNVPEDIALVGSGNWHISKLTQPKLTTTDFNLKQVAHAAVDMLVKKITGDTKNDSPSCLFVKPTLVLGGTT